MRPALLYCLLGYSTRVAHKLRLKDIKSLVRDGKIAPRNPAELKQTMKNLETFMAKYYKPKLTR